MTDTTREGPERLGGMSWDAARAVLTAHRTSIYAEGAKRNAEVVALNTALHYVQHLQGALAEAEDRANAFATKEMHTERRAETAKRQLADAQNEIERLREVMRTIVSRCQDAKRLAEEGYGVSAYNLASGILGQIGGDVAALTGEGETPAEPPWRIVTAPVAGPAPHLAWRAYSPERPGIGKHYAETEEAAIAKCEAALTGEGETNG